MAIVNTLSITNSMSNMDFVTDSFRVILDRGIMGLGSGILESQDGNQVAVVLPELHDDDNYSNVDLLKEMMSEFTLERANQFMLRPDLVDSKLDAFGTGIGSISGSDQPRGLFNIDFVLAYNPSAPSLYILDTTTIPYDWSQAVIFKTEPIDVTHQIVSFLDGDLTSQHSPLQPTNLKNMPWDDFRQTSIRLIVFLSSSSYDSINYQEV
jgi:hypothetical protein